LTITPNPTARVKPNTMNIIESFFKGALYYFILVFCFSLTLLIAIAICLFLELQEPQAQVQTMADAFNHCVARFLFHGTLFGTMAWKWHLVLAALAGLYNTLIENQ
jgi:hypothetical protein